VVLTPHPGEMARLTGKTVREVQQDRMGLARTLATDYGIWVILKGARTLTASPDGRMVNTTGTPWMASRWAGGRPERYPWRLARPGHTPRRGPPFRGIHARVGCGQYRTARRPRPGHCHGRDRGTPRTLSAERAEEE
jgi:hypothetical protein